MAILRDLCQTMEAALIAAVGEDSLKRKLAEVLEKTGEYGPR